MADRQPKQRLFDVSTRMMLVRETADPWMFLVLGAYVVLSAVAIVLAHEIFPGDRDSRGHVIEILGGLLVVLAAYFTAVTIRELRAQQAFERLARVLDQLSSANEAVRIGAVRLLESLALEKLDLPASQAAHDVATARQAAILDTLDAVSRESPESPVAVVARRVLDDLTRRGISVS